MGVRFFEEDTFDAGSADVATPAVARRQFSVSLAIALALLTAAAVMVLRERRQTPVEAATLHKIMRIEAPAVEAAPPAVRQG